MKCSDTNDKNDPHDYNIKIYPTFPKMDKTKRVRRKSLCPTPIIDHKD